MKTLVSILALLIATSVSALPIDDDRVAQQIANDPKIMADAVAKLDATFAKSLRFKFVDISAKVAGDKFTATLRYRNMGHDIFSVGQAYIIIHGQLITAKTIRVVSMNEYDSAQ